MKKKREIQRKKKPSYLREIQIKFKKKRIKENISLDTPLTDSQQVFELFKDMQNETKEKLITINLDTKCKIICFEVVAIGSIDTLLVRPMEIFRTAIITNAYSTIVVHNHPSGDAAPSTKDKKFSAKLKKISVDLGLHFLDHIIIGDSDYFSFADKQLL